MSRRRVERECWRDEDYDIGNHQREEVSAFTKSSKNLLTHRRFQSRAFMLLPMTFNIGVIIGPILGNAQVSNPRSQTNFAQVVSSQIRYNSILASLDPTP
jgi:hypothetical protein